MVRKICFATVFISVLGLGVFGQKGIIREEYLRITPYISTLEDVTKVYGEGHNITKGREDYLSIEYTINENIEVSIDYFRDCNQTDKPEKERMWIVKEVFFSFEKDLRLKPKDIFLDKKDFTACPYGDVGGQIIYFNDTENIRFTYLSLVKALSSLRVMATEINKERYKCKEAVTSSLDPKGFRCKSPN
jgi:hypothetical protein